MKSSLIFHGGAGVIEKGKDQSIHIDALKEIALQAKAILQAAEKDDKTTAVDVAERVVRLLENHELFNAGKGAVYTEDGLHELDASIMDGATLAGGAVAGVRHLRHPVTAARLVMERSPHILFFGADAGR